MTISEFFRKIRIKNKGAHKIVGKKKLGPAFWKCRAERVIGIRTYFLTGKGVQMGSGE